MKRFILKFILFITIPFGNIVAQTDTLPKHHLSSNVVAGVLAGELGFYYDYSLTRLTELRLSIAHRFYQPNIIENGGYGSDFEYLACRANNIRIGFKQYFNNHQKSKIGKYYFVVQCVYLNMNTPKYTTRYGSNGLNEIYRSVISVERNMVGGSVGIGKTIYKNRNFFTESFLLCGFTKGNKVTTKYSGGNSGEGNEYDYNPNIIIKEKGYFPILDLGITLGYCWN